MLPVLALAWAVGVATAGWAFQRVESGGRVQLQPAVIALVVREGCARLLLSLVGPLGWGRSRLRRRVVEGVPDKGLPPVLLVPGVGWSRSSLMFLRTFLVRRGWPWVWALDRKSRRGSTLAMEARHLGQLVREAQQLTGAEEVDVVAFSSGGLALAWALRHDPDLGPRIRRMVTLATPWRGTKLAGFRRGVAYRELRFGSPVLDGLWPAGHDLVCVWSPDDPVVVPAESATPPSGNGSDISIEAAGHVELLISARAFRAVQSALEHA